VILAAGVSSAPLRQAVVKWLPAKWQITLSTLRHGVLVDHTIDIPMPDGVRLKASLYLPRGAAAPLPTVLVRSPYGRLRAGGGFDAGIFFARHGYAVLVQDLRGTGDSEGLLMPWQHAAEDGVATLDWISRQPWSTGRVGTYGCSALGETQFVLARKGHPAHAAMIPSGAGGAIGSAAGRFAYFGVFEGGVFQLASGFGWFVDHGAKDPATPPAAQFDRRSHLRDLPVSTLIQQVRPGSSGYDDFLATPLSDSKWSDWGYLTDSDAPRVPALIINTWGDQTVGDTLALAESWRRRDPGTAAGQKVVIAPGTHCDHGESGATPTRFGELTVEGAGRPWQDWYLQWFGYWLKGEGRGLPDMEAYTFFILGENRWESSAEWPPASARIVRWYLGSGGSANSRQGNGILAPERSGTAAFDQFRYDPDNPVPSRGGPICCTGDGNDKAGPADQADVEIRDDVLVYTTAPLAQGLRIAGPLRAKLSVSSSATDTDFVVRLVHVWPDGRATGIQEGAMRLRYRDGFTSPTLMEPGRRYEVLVDMRSIAYAVPEGHRLRLHVTSSSFPRLERNLNTGAENNAQESRVEIAVNKVHHDRDGESYVELPLLPARQ
jgi:putative CocE/NonD family hydrolase